MGGLSVCKSSALAAGASASKSRGKGRANSCNFFCTYSCHQKSAYTMLHCCNWQHNPASPNAPAFQFNILLGIAQPSLSIERFRLHSKLCVSVKCLRPATGAVQQSAVCSRSQSQGARGGTNSGNLFRTGSAMCCGSLCKWLH